MISVPQIGLKSVFTQGPFTQNAVDANDILLAYAYAFGLGENDPFILGHNTYSLKNLRIASENPRLFNCRDESVTMYLCTKPNLQKNKHSKMYCFAYGNNV